MKILELELQNFRCFDKATFDFSEKFNLLIGDNATGKTVILDALAIAAGSFFLGIDGIPPHNITKDEIRRITKIEGEIPTVEIVLPVVISCAAFVENMKINPYSEEEVSVEVWWSRELKKIDGRTTRQDAPIIIDYANQLQQKIRGQSENLKPVILPIISYYGTGRLWVQKRLNKTETIKPGSRFRGYENCLNNSYEIKKIMQWFKTLEWASVQQGKELNTLVGVKDAIKNCMEDWQDVRYDVKLDELVAISKNGKILPFRMLSDGVKNMIAMVADIAYRCATLNPQFEANAAQLTPGIVIIDEIDLHLHPRWQRRIVEDLQRTFPNIQFFATTHSPFIIQSLRQGKLINLNDSPPSEYEIKSIEESIEDVAEDIMGIELPQYSRRKLAMLEAAEEYYKVLQEAESCDQSDPIRLEKLKERLDELSLPFSDNPAYHAFLNMERLAKGV